MLSRQEFEERYIKAAEAAMRLHVDSQGVHRLIQRGVLDGLYKDGRWYATIESVERLRQKRETATKATFAAAGAVA